MPTTRNAAASARASRRRAVKRTVLGAVDDNPAGTETETKTETDAGAVPSKAVPVEAAAAVVPADLDGTSSSQIELLLQDLERETESRIKSIEERAAQAVEEQREAAFLGSIRLDRSVKAMTLGEFSERHGGDVLAEVLAAFRSGGEGAAAGKKRVRRGSGAATGMELETPAPRGRAGGIAQTPGTILRTARRGEQIFSANGSPVEHSEEGSLVATVAKKRGGRKGLGGDGDGGGGDLGVGFDINVGDGRFISLSDPSTINHLEDDMKDAAVSQLKILQDQMASLMAQLGN